MKWFPVTFLTNGVLKVTHGGIELTTPVLGLRMLQSKAPFIIESVFQRALFGQENALQPSYLEILGF